jgi:hypothetical protein
MGLGSASGFKNDRITQMIRVTHLGRREKCLTSCMVWIQSIRRVFCPSTAEERIPICLALCCIVWAKKVVLCLLWLSKYQPETDSKDLLQKHCCSPLVVRISSLHTNESFRRGLVSLLHSDHSRIVGAAAVWFARLGVGLNFFLPLGVAHQCLEDRGNLNHSHYVCASCMETTSHHFSDNINLGFILWKSVQCTTKQDNNLGSSPWEQRPTHFLLPIPLHKIVDPSFLCLLPEFNIDKEPCRKIPLKPALWSQLGMNDYLDNYPGGSKITLQVKRRITHFMHSQEADFFAPIKLTSTTPPISRSSTFFCGIHLLSDL